jgi:hypothetical protein
MKYMLPTLAQQSFTNHKNWVKADALWWNPATKESSPLLKTVPSTWESANGI